MITPICVYTLVMPGVNHANLLLNVISTMSDNYKTMNGDRMGHLDFLAHSLRQMCSKHCECEIVLD